MVVLYALITLYTWADITIFIIRSPPPPLSFFSPLPSPLFLLLLLQLLMRINATQSTEEFQYAQCVLRKRKLKAALSPYPGPLISEGWLGTWGSLALSFSSQASITQVYSEIMRKWDKARAVQHCVEAQTCTLTCHRLPDTSSLCPKTVTAASLSITPFSHCSVFTPEKINRDTQAQHCLHFLITSNLGWDPASLT